MDLDAYVHFRTHTYGHDIGELIVHALGFGLVFHFIGISQHIERQGIREHPIQLFQF